MRVKQSKFTKKTKPNKRVARAQCAGPESAFMKLETILYPIFYAWFMDCEGYT